VLLSAVNVVFGYDDARVIDDVSLDVSDGEIVGILGPNGSGKTTLLRLLAGALTPQSGIVKLGRSDVTSLPARELAQQVAVVPQETSLAFDYTVLEIVLMGRYPHLARSSSKDPTIWRPLRGRFRQRARRPLAERAYRTLSGGEKQRVVIASALAQLDSETAAPKLLVLDEPTASLDLKYQFETGSVLRRLHAASGLTILLSTHDLRFAASLCTRIVLLAIGRILAQGRPAKCSRRTWWAGCSTCRRTGGADSRVGDAGMTLPLRRGLPKICALFLGDGGAVVAAPFIGSTSITFTRVFSTSAAVRGQHGRADSSSSRGLPRALAAALVGGTLPRRRRLSGTAPQPLATPYTLGVSAGASLGAMSADHVWIGLGRRRGAGEPRRRLPRRRHRLCAGQRAASGPVHHGAAPGGRDAELILFRADSVRAVRQRLRAERSARCAG
jgi:iron complex transport system ATP-binding protein